MSSRKEAERLTPALSMEIYEMEILARLLIMGSSMFSTMVATTLTTKWNLRCGE
jgi:hypothetical protein